MDPISSIQGVIFIIGTIFLLFISRKSLRSFKYHGFYRLFVFEFTLALILLNIPYWFDDLFSVRQIASWILLLYSGFLLVQSFYLFQKYGGSRQRRDYAANFEFEDTTTLIQTGIYKYIRHPMYGSLLFLDMGAMFKHISVITVLLTLAAIVFIFLTAKTEEKENIKFFGNSYIGYMKESKMFIPFIL